MDQPLEAGSLQELLTFMAERSRRSLGSFSRQWTFLPQQIVPIVATKPAESAPAGMIRIPGGGYDFDVRGIEIEGGNDPGVDVQYPWEDSPRRFHHHRIDVCKFLYRSHTRNKFRVQEIRRRDPTIIPMTITISCAIGRMEPIRTVGMQNQ